MPTVPMATALGGGESMSVNTLLSSGGDTSAGEIETYPIANRSKEAHDTNNSLEEEIEALQDVVAVLQAVVEYHREKDEGR